MKRISQQYLEEIARCLSARDMAVLSSIQKCRYITSRQIKRLHFTNNTGKRGATIAANRALAKLHDYKLINSIERRIGGVRAGSGANVWLLSENGLRLLEPGRKENTHRKNNFEPSLNFLQHTLAVAEVYVQLTELCRSNQIELVKAESEPDCWRPYTGEDNKPASMKPDMYAVTINGEYEDSWFIEVDMNTQSPSVVLDKCRRYVRYRNSGIEQKEHGVFPLVVWIVNKESRKDKLKQYIAECRDISENNKALFTVIMPDEFEALIRQGGQC
jgi:hypothetical protein